MKLNRKLDTKTYIETKKNAYSFAKVLTKDEIVNSIQKLDIADPEEATIYISTLLYPNDLDIIQVVYEKYNLEQLSKLLNIPSKIIQLKAREYVNYNLPQLIKQNKDLNALCHEQTNLSTSETIDEIIASKLK